MTASFTYMGTKRQIANSVAEVIYSTRKGPLLDLFAGISAVGTAVSPGRQIWCNDVQHFAYTLATAIFTSKSAPHATGDFLSAMRGRIAFNKRRAMREFSHLVAEEKDILKSRNIARAALFSQRLVRSSFSEKNAQMRCLHRNSSVPRPYRLFAITFAGGYVGLQQSIDIDSIRYGLDTLRLERRLNLEQHRWAILALCKAVANVANTTGHFVQYLAIKPETFDRYLAKRNRDVFVEWCRALAAMSPEGTSQWRTRNKTFRGDANALLEALPQSKGQPAVVYADPPYTNDHYSRYYHLLDTLILYDYPEPAGKGQYRPDRFVSDFSIRTKVLSAFHKLVANAADLGCELVVNYPSSGLLPDARSSLLEILRQYFRHSEIALAISHQHSSCLARPITSLGEA
jgi:adenine-specific DNA-methyltransferase